MTVVLYTIGCPRCIILENKLNAKHIDYTTVTDETIMVSKNINTLPVLEVDGEKMDFGRAVKWVNEN